MFLEANYGAGASGVPCEVHARSRTEKHHARRIEARAIYRISRGQQYRGTVDQSFIFHLLMFRRHNINHLRFKYTRLSPSKIGKKKRGVNVWCANHRQFRRSHWKMRSEKQAFARRGKCSNVKIVAIRSLLDHVSRNVEWQRLCSRMKINSFIQLIVFQFLRNVIYDGIIGLVDALFADIFRSGNSGRYSWQIRVAVFLLRGELRSALRMELELLRRGKSLCETKS